MILYVNTYIFSSSCNWPSDLNKIPHLPEPFRSGQEGQTLLHDVGITNIRIWTIQALRLNLDVQPELFGSARARPGSPELGSARQGH
jgi:hypothetical protein